MSARTGCALLLAAGAAHAQIAGEFLDRKPAEAAQAAFETPYGGRLAAEFGKALRENAEPRCLRATGIDPSTLEARGREVLVRAGTHMLEIYENAVDRRKLEASFAAHAGRDAPAEQAALRRDADVSTYLALLEQARLARLAEHVADTVGEHAAARRFRLGSGPAKWASDNPALARQNPASGYQQEAQRFSQQRASPALRRWIELSYRMTESLQSAANYDRVLRLRPQDMTPELSNDLANLCIPQG